MRFLSRRRSASAAVADSARERSLSRIRRATAELLEDRKLLAANLNVSVSATPQPTVNAGADITYDVTVRNTGTDLANNVVLTFDPDDAAVPPNERSVFRQIIQLSGPAFVITNPGVNNQGNVTATLGQMNAGLASTFRILYRVDPATAENTVINATADATTTDPEVTLADNAADDSVVVSTRADVQVTKTQISPVGNAVAGLDVTYEIVVVNNGPSVANNVTMIDIVPANTSFVSATVDPAFTLDLLPPVGSAGTFQASLASMASGQTATFTMTLHIASDVTGTLFNTASVSTTTFDPALANNQATVGGAIAIETDLVIVSTTNKAVTLYEGKYFTYTVNIINRGPSDATGVSFTFQTPDTGKTAARELVYYGNSPVNQISGPAFGFNIPADPPRRGNIVGQPTAPQQRLQAGVGATFEFEMATSEDNDLVQTSTIGGATPDVDPTNNTWVDNVHLFDAPLVVQEVPPIQGNENQPIDAEVMIFTDTNMWPEDTDGTFLPTAGIAPPGTYRTAGGRLGEMPDFIATVDWGDGTTPSPGVVTLDLQGQYHVAARHTYATAGVFPVLITVTSDGEATAIGQSTAYVGQPARGGAQVAGLQFIEDVSETKKIATFFKGSAGSSVTFTGTINWGDGTGSSAATLTNNGLSIDVIGTHTFTNIGTYNATVTVVGSDGITNQIPVTINVVPQPTVPPPPPPGGGPGPGGTVTPISVSFNGVEGQTLTNVIAGRFTTTDTAAVPGDFVATIDWGDGSPTSTGTIAQTGPGAFNVLGTHQYTDDGTYNVTISVAPAVGGGTPTDIASTAVIRDAALRGISRLFNATAGQPFNGQIGAFIDGNPFDITPSDYLVTVDWGDGTASTGATITYNAGLKQFVITGNHTYATASPAGGYKLKISIRDGLSQVAITSTATVV